MALAHPPVAVGAGGLGGWVLGELWRWAVSPGLPHAPAAAVFPGDSVRCDCTDLGWDFVLHFLSNEAASHWRIVLGVLLLAISAVLLRLGFGGFVLAFEFRPSGPGERHFGPRRVAAYRSGASSSSLTQHHD